jgi:hypothetical protein
MNCCDLSSTGLNDITANNITSDNITIFSKLNISGFSNLNELLVNDNATFISSLNISGFTTLNNKTSLFSSLNVSGFTTLNNDTTILSALNVSGFTTLNNDINIYGQLNVSGLHVLDVLNIHKTGLSTLYNFRSDNSNSFVRLIGTSILVHSPLASSNSNFLGGASQSACLTKIDETGKINVFHPYNILLPNKLQGFWVVHDEIEGFHQQAIINASKF